MEKAGERKNRKVNRRKNKAENDKQERTIVQDQQERKKHLHESDSSTIKIRLYIWQVNCNYKKDNTDIKCPLCKKSEDITERVLECEKAKNFTLSKENSKGQWEEITKIYRKNKSKRKLN